MPTKWRWYGESGHANAHAASAVPYKSAGATKYEEGTFVALSGSAGKIAKLSNAASLRLIVGLVEFEQDVKADETVLVREVTPHTLLESIGVEANARVANTELDLENDGDLTTDSVSHVRIMRTSTASEPTTLRLQTEALAYW